MTRTVRFSIGIFALALLLRVVTLLFTLPQLRPHTDLDSYRSLAAHLAQGEGFKAETSNGRVLPNVARTPVYPLFLAALIKLGGNRLGLFLAVQCLLGSLTCVLTALLALHCLRPGAAALAGLLVALDPNSILRCSDLRTETLFTLLLLGGACLIAWYPRRAWSWLAVGFLWSLAALTRPIAIWIWLVALFILTLISGASVPPANSYHAKSRRSAFLFLIFLIGFLPLLFLWSARNKELTGHYFISTISTYNLLMYRAAGVAAEQEGTTQEVIEQRWLTTYGDIQFVQTRDKFEQFLRQYEQAIHEKLFSAPILLVKQTVTGSGKLLLGPGTRALDNAREQTRPSSKWWPPIYVAILLAAFLLSVVGIKRMGWGAVVPVVLLFYFVALSSGPESNSRFRVPITPFLAVLAIAGVYGTEKRQ